MMRKTMELRVSNLETVFDEFKNEIKITQGLILLQLQSLVAKCNGGSLGESSEATLDDPHLQEGMNPNFGPDSQCLNLVPNLWRPFIKMVSCISILKSNKIVLMLQSFHKEKIRAQEKAYEFFLNFVQDTSPRLVLAYDSY
ncbi:hypothetical protein D8674_028768 [Pyrus ussuriensis x Pyrus communis]|uniref:Uncharacterized protein n=1 Tax=Pyrus ussuriensis x Pyrus communis TaxID=2448454 RepID=A0A5N5I221_9ROSA|nr:hypothetical protein D8674_028768 [Pyrus ussuriensis x Pyrus communis]